uniref:Uncharacterized protein n=1 Tax=Parascaris equorum TaxID=6256 RepID=A0A914S742_PAREQ
MSLEYQNVRQEHIKVSSVKDAETNQEIKSGNSSIDLIGVSGKKLSVTFAVNSSSKDNPLNLKKGTTKEVIFNTFSATDARPTLASTNINSYNEIIGTQSFADFKSQIQKGIISQIKSNSAFVDVTADDVEFTGYEFKGSNDTDFHEATDEDFADGSYYSNSRQRATLKVTVKTKEKKYSRLSQNEVGNSIVVQASRVSYTGKPLLSECPVLSFDDVFIKNSFDEFKTAAIDKIVDLVSKTAGYAGFTRSMLNVDNTVVTSLADNSIINSDSSYRAKTNYKSNARLAVKVVLVTEGVGGMDK